MTRIFPDDTANRVAALCALYLRAPSGYATEDTTGDPVLDFEPALSTAEQTTYADLLAMARAHISGLSLAEYQALKPDLAGLRTYQGLASPTLAQTASAVKAQTRILRALLRD